MTFNGHLRLPILLASQSTESTLSSRSFPGPNCHSRNPFPARPIQSPTVESLSMNGHPVEEHQSSNNMAILTKVDKLRELIGNRIALPQLIVVGDQSTGKSSVLESVTGFAFPRALELCTRYATQITCRRDDIESINVSIIPDQDSSPQEQARLRKFQRRLEDLDSRTLVQLFKDANEAMGIGIAPQPILGKSPATAAFSQHMLKIEKLGPDEEHFTVIDVPGIFRNNTTGETTDADIDLVMNMVKKYMKEQRTIILAIMPCNIDPATQEILKLAKNVDPNMTRTMAVLTKPDLATESAIRQIAIDYILAKRGDLTLGYYIVRNRGPDEANMTLEQGRDKERSFFNQGPWSVLRNSGRAGTEALKARVRELLIDLIKKEFPKVKVDVFRELATLRAQLEEMGPSRGDQHTQRAYLTRLAEAFQLLSRDALKAYYTSNDIFSRRLELRLITRIVEENDQYSDRMWKSGHLRPFAKSPKAGNQQQPEPEESEPQRLALEKEFEKNIEEYPELRDILERCNTSAPEMSGSAKIMDHIGEVYKDSRGQELGTFGAGLLATMFKEQSKKWEMITLSHMSKVIITVHRFILETLKAICPDSGIRDELWDGHLLEELRKSYLRALDHTRFLIELEREGGPLTLNHYFNDNLQKDQNDRLATTIKNLGSEEIVEKPAAARGYTATRESGIFIHPDTLKHLSVYKANAEHVREHMHDVLRSYYKVSRKRFVDVVCQQAISYHLLTGKHSPLKIFSTEMVLSLSEAQLNTIAAEHAPLKRRREKLDQDIENFERALKVLKSSG